MTGSNPEYRFDPLRGEYVIVAPHRAARPRPPHTAGSWDEASPCPFCPGSESETPPEVLAFRPDGSKANAPGWRVRVVPNRYPAVVLDETLVGGDPAGAPVGRQRLAGYGSHEVIVETPDHDATIATRPINCLQLSLIAYRERLRSLRRDDRLAHVQVFKNAGRAAGATRRHPHSQIVALSTLPRAIAVEIDALDEYRRRTSSCLICDTTEREVSDGRRLVLRDDRYTVLCPYASRVPFETRIIPRAHTRDFAASSDEELLSLAIILKKTIQALARVLENPSYNLILHTAPSKSDAASGDDVDFHWRVEILPRVAHLAGFEWGTGMYINHLAPEEAAERLRGQLPA